MVRGVLVGVGGAAIVVIGLVGCSTKNSEDKSSGVEASATISVPVETAPATATATVSATETAPATASASVAPGAAKVSIDGQAKDIQGQVACTTAMGNLSIGIGEAATGVAVVMSPDASKVTSVGLGNVNGVVLGYQEGAPGGTATATKVGDTYTISGTASGIDAANPLQPTTKPFEIQVTCP